MLTPGRATVPLYRPGQERDKRPSIEYLDAMQRAINHVARLEGQKERPLPSDLLGKHADSARGGEE